MNKHCDLQTIETKKALLKYKLY